MSCFLSKDRRCRCSNKEEIKTTPKKTDINVIPKLAAPSSLPQRKAAGSYNPPSRSRRCSSSDRARDGDLILTQATMAAAAMSAVEYGSVGCGGGGGGCGGGSCVRGGGGCGEGGCGEGCGGGGCN
ncbi:hypothetical protein CRG98_032344 [Punica granatum]|uniref:Uncharacterized protein n=1 Tax=Punica granatum TaxID=22663 RepID=A0A2I0ITB2_PUNGR|nr:hypothetical protein CRG98_032344 [Punica granatum]